MDQRDHPRWVKITSGYVGACGCYLTGEIRPISDAQIAAINKDIDRRRKALPKDQRKNVERFAVEPVAAPWDAQADPAQPLDATESTDTEDANAEDAEKQNADELSDKKTKKGKA